MSNADLTRQFYQGDGGKIYHHQHRALPAAAEAWVAEKRAQKIQPHVKESDAVFEFGVGFGWNLAALRCASKTGHDIDPTLRNHVQRHGIEFMENLDSIASKTFDVILCHHVLEHVPNPAASIEQLSNSLKPGGLLLIFVPYEKERRYRRFNPNEPNHHMFSWNPQTLGNFVSAAGFELVSIGLGKFRLDRFASRLAIKCHLGRNGFRLIRFCGLLIAPEFEVRAVARKPIHSGNKSAL